MENKSRILLLLKYLYRNTDAEHDVSSRELIDMLTAEGVRAPDRRTIDTDVDLLNAAGCDIERVRRNGVATRYRVASRLFETVELKIMIDAIAASRFLTANRSRRIITRLAALASRADQERLLAGIDKLDEFKDAQGTTLYVANDLYAAIVAKRKVSFEMFDYSIPDLNPVPHRDGQTYIVSPYAMIWNTDRYYLIAYETKRNMIITPRPDHIRNVKLLPDPVDPTPPGFDIRKYCAYTYKMYPGPERNVTLLCNNDLVGKLVDHFGHNIQCWPIDENHFRAVVHTVINVTFFGWLFQYAGEMALVGPRDVVDQYTAHCQAALQGLQA